MKPSSGASTSAGTALLAPLHGLTVLVTGTALAVLATGCAGTPVPPPLPPSIPRYQIDLVASEVRLKNATDADEVKTWIGEALTEIEANASDRSAPKPARFLAVLNVLGPPGINPPGLAEMTLTLDVGGQRERPRGRALAEQRGAGAPRYPRRVSDAPQRG